MGESTRLLSSFTPAHYTVALAIDRKAKTITGHTTVSGIAAAAQMALNQKYLKVSAVSANGAAVPYTVDDATERIDITLPKAGDVTLAVDYTAPLTDSMMGIYPSYYQVDGVRKQIIGTQFETTAARQAFPSVDEPAAKATFDLAVKFDEQPGETIIANMPQTKVVDGYHHFATTVKMATYLVAFAFGDLQSKLTHTKSGVEIGVFATKAHAAKELDFALDIAKRSIEFYEDFYQTPYPLPHSYQLALPDFSAGAMENWGLVTYREAYLTIDPAHTSLEMQQRVATVVAHELAHQWFGDLVTMQWWDDLWLNESFANMMEYVAVDALMPQWHIWETFQTDEAIAALTRDATDGVQAVHVQVEDPAEIDALFDSAIVYAKGSRMLVMVRALLGDEALRAGLKQYFAKHQYANATGADLWAALGAASDIDVGAVMNSWLEQPGYPVVSASVVDGHLQLRQQQFFIGQGQDRGRLWQIPLKANFNAPQLMQDATLDLGDYAQLRSQAGHALRLNDGNESHFIVHYDAALLNDIMQDVTQLDAITQMQLIQDQRLLAEGRQLGYAEVVAMLPNFADSHSQIVQAALYTLANSLKKFTTPHSAENAALRKLFAKLSESALKRLGWTPKDSDTFADTLARPYVLNAALYAKTPNALLAAHEQFEAHATQPQALPADTRVYILRNELANFNTAEKFTQLLDAYRTSADANYKRDLCAALTQTPDLAQLKIVVAAFEDADTIKPQDLRAWFAGVLANPEGQQLAWDWLRTRWSWLEATVGGDMEFPTYITVTSRVFETPERLAEFIAFFKPLQQNPGLSREIAMDTTVIQSRVDLVAAEAQAVNAAVAQAIA